jgi:hypothetical protein
MRYRVRVFYGVDLTLLTEINRRLGGFREGLSGQRLVDDFMGLILFLNDILRSFKELSICFCIQMKVIQRAGNIFCRDILGLRLKRCEDKICAGVSAWL